jgi:hypothetical protein
MEHSFFTAKLRPLWHEEFRRSLCITLVVVVVATLSQATLQSSNVQLVNGRWALFFAPSCTIDWGSTLIFKNANAFVMNPSSGGSMNV